MKPNRSLWRISQRPKRSINVGLLDCQMSPHTTACRFQCTNNCDLFANTILSIATKCNSDLELVKKLASLGANFDCASYNEIKLLIDVGISPSRMLYTNPIKSPASLLYAREVGVNTATVDNSDEIRKMKQYHPGSKLHIRIIEDDDDATTKLGTKFGVTIETACQLLEEATDLNLEVEGVSFHVGTR